MSEVCEFCDAFYCKNEVNSSKKYTKCCHDGKAHLPNLTEAPDLFKELLCSNSQEAKNYRQQIREYNVALAFASMGLNKGTSWSRPILLPYTWSDLSYGFSSLF
ncbi:hypothetical protein AVEN_209094-1 [Araneus ventricosus]|uniref:Uncharacterized protein n=1 Tax=Araneus ventricosus TaxID=182803 RepID=A0A4Y2IHX0_ARAVE|nr:hypothetical protein AVEN_209094-1 [Araneus ventricosus]